MLLAAGTAWAGEKPLYAPVPAWVVPAPAVDTAKLTDGDPLVLVLDQQIRLDGDTSQVYVETATRIANTQILAQAGTIQLPWVPDKGDLIVHAAEILRAGERIDLLAGEARFSVLRREQMLEQGQVNGVLTATMAVQGLRVGDVLRVAFSVSTRDPALKGRVQGYAGLVAGPAPVKFGRLRLQWPAGMKVKWKSHVQTAAFKFTTAGGNDEVVASMPLSKLAEIPADAPQRFKLLPLVEVTSFGGWGDVVNVMTPLYATKGTIVPGSPLAAEVAKIAAQSKDPRTRAALALRLVQDEVRYLYNGMEGGNYVPQTPEQTWSLRYGDCKAKTLLLTAILHELGVDAVPAMVSTTLGDLLPERLPSPGAFDHVIVRAQIGGQVLWLDGTAQGARIDDLGDVPPYRHALPMRPGTTALEAMPLKGNARPDFDLDIEVDSSAGLSLPAPVKLRLALRGQQSELLRMIQAMGDPDKLDAMVDLLVDEIAWSPTLVSRSVAYDAASGATVITASGMSYPDWADKDGRVRLEADRTVGDIDFAPDRARPSWRDIPVATGDVENRRVALRIRLPGAGEGFTLDGDQVLPPALGGVELKRSVLLADGWLTIEDRSVKGTREIAPADIPAERGRLNVAKSRRLTAIAPAGYPPRWRLAAALKDGPGLQRLRAIYDQKIADDPTDADGYTKRAWFLERIGDHAGALKDLDMVVTLAPSVDAYLERGAKRFALGNQRGALADAQEAYDLDSASDAAFGFLVDQLSRDGGTDEALGMVEERLNAGGKREALASLKADVLARAGRVTEGLAALDEAIAAKPGLPALLNSRCWFKGTNNVELASALKDCTRAIELVDDSSPVLDSRGLIYFRMGRMEEALADFDAALEQNPEMAASLFMRGIVRRRIGGAENLKAAEDDLAGARAISPGVDARYAQWGIKP
ncbi:DUF3857 domain-containing protein [Sphingomonas canadensis]|uniref:DUF3857 domain-containing protein n=1 Tax=Sphingomonas canadensis TaxID=1219257 RepID=A0ABW3H9B5_9SPHN|nr:DUF3857 domain-containing protein [Sphingomonas canadensis]